MVKPISSPLFLVLLVSETLTPTRADDRDNVLLREAPMLMTHDAATGYVGFWDPRKGFLKTQEVGFQGQLECGVRAFDLRLVERLDGKAHFHHLPGAGVPADVGAIDQHLEGELPVFMKFGSAHPDDLVVLYFSHCTSTRFENRHIAREPQFLGVPP